MVKARPYGLSRTCWIPGKTNQLWRWSLISFDFMGIGTHLAVFRANSRLNVQGSLLLLLEGPSGASAGAWASHVQGKYPNHYTITPDPRSLISVSIFMVYLRRPSWLLLHLFTMRFFCSCWLCSCCSSCPGCWMSMRPFCIRWGRDYLWGRLWWPPFLA